MPPKLATGIPPLAPEAQGKTYSNVPKLAYKGNIIFFAQAYTPVTPTPTQPHPLAYLNRIIAQYEQLHPGITIQLVPPAQVTGNYVTWLRTQIAGAQAPDIFWAQWSTVDSDLPHSTVLALDPWMANPDPYVASAASSSTTRPLRAAFSAATSS